MEKILVNHLRRRKRVLKLLQGRNEKRKRSYLIINMRGIKARFYEEKDGERVGITGNRKRIYELARARYRLEKISEAKLEIALIEHLLSGINKVRGGGGKKALQTRYEKAGLDMRKIAFESWQIKGLDKQSENPFRREDLIWKTNRGILTRSKSERDFCNRLDKFGVPFQYEKALVVNMTGMENTKGIFYREGVPYKCFYPDFTIFLADGSLMFIEHLGRIDIEDYRRSSGNKLIVLYASGVADNEHLLVTFERDMENLDKIDEFIIEKIIPYI